MGLREAVGLNGFESALLIIGLIFCLIFVFAFIFLVSGKLKDSADPENKSGTIGWIIAIIIVCLVLYFLATTNSEPNYRHSENIIEYIQNTCSA